METQLIAAIAVIVMLVVYGKLTDHMRKKGIPIPGEDEEVPAEADGKAFVAVRPHLCPEVRGARETFMPQARIRSVRIGKGPPIGILQTDPSGQTVLSPAVNEVGAIVCDGVFCADCGQRLICASCGKTPVKPRIVADETEHSAILSCCDRPFWVESGIPDHDEEHVPKPVGQGRSNVFVGPWGRPDDAA